MALLFPDNFGFAAKHYGRNRRANHHANEQASMR